MSGTVLRTRRFVTSVALAAALSGMSQLALAQTDEQRAGARTLATEGAAAFNEGRFKEAVDLFSRAESLVHAPPHLLFMARAHAKLGQFVKAREAYLKIIKEQLAPNAPQAFRDAQVTAEEERKQVEPHIGRLLIQVEGAEGAKDLAVTVDGQPFPTVMLGVPQPMDPGQHTVTATATGFRGAPASVTLKDGGSGSVVVQLEVDPNAQAAAPATAGDEPAGAPLVSAPSGAPPSDTGPAKGPNGLRIASYASFGVGVAGLAVGTIFVLKSAGNRKDADALAEEIGCDGDKCNGTSSEQAKLDQLDSDANSAQTLGIVGYAVGGVGIAAGVTLFLLSNKERPKSAFVAPYFGPGAVGVHGAF